MKNLLTQYFTALKNGQDQLANTIMEQILYCKSYEF